MTDSKTEPIVNIIEPYFEKYKNVENLEIEFRLGFIDDHKFDSFVCKEFFDKILTTLQTNKSWDSVEKTSTTDYIHNGIRLSTDSDKNKTCIRKEKLCVLDFCYDDTPFDLRVCFSTETPLDNKEFVTQSKNDKKNIFKRKKTRSSFQHKTWYYDITCVNSVDNTVKDTNYEIELECDVVESLKTMSSHYIIDSGLMKIQDLINMCEPLTEESKLILIKTREYGSRSEPLDNLTKRLEKTKINEP